jgi:hypothetical protein
MHNQAMLWHFISEHCTARQVQLHTRTDGA